VDLAPGAVLRGKYLLTSIIGRGGMGEVFAARRLEDQREVAIKVVSHRIVDDTLMARLEREAIAARRIRSIYVPEVYEIERTEDGELYLVMRLLHGESLQARLKERRALHWPEVERIVDDVLSALADAHAAGVVHRDLKPANIFLEQVEEPTIPSYTPATSWIPGTTLERAMILDFGVCKLDTSDGPKLTVTGESVGTVSYMAPEQIRGASDVDGRADIYSLAMVIFEALSGRIAFDATGQMAILAAKLEGRAKRLRDCAVVAVPPGLDALVAKALSRKPESRFASAREMQQAWRALGQATESPRAQIGASLPPTYATQNALTAGTHTRVGGLLPRIGLLAASAGVFASAVAIGLALHRHAAPHETPAIEALGEGPLPTAPPSAPASAPPAIPESSAPTTVLTTPTIEILDDDVPDAAATPATHHRPHNNRVWHRHRHVVPTQTGPHITTEPRY
jgi:serine/threonine protein kinase